VARLARSPLLLAVVIALVPAVVLAVVAGPLRHRAVDPTAAVATPAPAPSPTSPQAPRPQPLPSIIAPDVSSLGAPGEFGRIDVVGYDHHGDVSIATYALAAPPPTLPSSLPVWHLRGFAPGDTSTLQSRIGVAPPSPPFPGDGPDGKIDAALAQLSAGGGTAATLFTIGVQPKDETSAITAATSVLSDLGLLPQNVSAAATSTTEGPTPTPVWQVSFTHRPIEGIPVGFGAGTGVAEVDVSTLGNVTRLWVDAPALDGGAAYPLRSVAEAWDDVRGGHWFDECCWVNTGGGGAPARLGFRADTVELVYEQTNPPPMKLVPMYVFTDSKNRLSLAVPALRAADLSEPGGFRLVEPGSQ
jgi:hypothetical protein